MTIADSLETYFKATNNIIIVSVIFQMYIYFVLLFFVVRAEEAKKTGSHSERRKRNVDKFNGKGKTRIFIDYSKREKH